MYLSHPTFEVPADKRNHLFRHESEIRNEPKGGYLNGKVRLPLMVHRHTAILRISLVPAKSDADMNPYNFHTNLLYLNLKNRRKLKQNLKSGEADLSERISWALYLKLVNGEDLYFLDVVTKKEDKEMDRRPLRESTEYGVRLSGFIKNEKEAQHHFLFKLNTPNEIEFGGNGLKVNVITPLLKKSECKEGTSVEEAIRYRFKDCYGRDIDPETLSSIERYFTNKKEARVNSQQVRVSVEMFSSNHEFIDLCVSPIIMNSKSKECGPLHLHDINPSVGCTIGSTKIFLLSFFKLMNDVQSRFILYNPRTQDIENDLQILRSLNQPKNHTVFNQFVIITEIPPQDPRVIQAIVQRGLDLRIAAYRPLDASLSHNSFKFTYFIHRDPCEACGILRPVDQPSNLPSAGPGVRRRLSGPAIIQDQTYPLNYSLQKRPRMIESPAPLGENSHYANLYHQI